MGYVLRNLDWSVLIDVLKSVIPALICITVHELSHGYAAYRLGDNTAKDMGRITLNPIKHIDVFGLLMMVVFKFGWAKPVPVNMTNFKHPKRDMAITALAGPVSNLLLAVVVMFIYGLAYGLIGDTPDNSTAGIVLEMIFITAYINVALAIFNLIPIPPLDGSKVLFSLVSDSAYIKLMRYERFGVIILIVILSTNIFDESIGKVTQALFSWLMGVARASYGLVS